MLQLTRANSDLQLRASWVYTHTHTHTCEPLLRNDSRLSSAVFIKDLLLICLDRATLDGRGKRAHIVAHRYIGLYSRTPRKKRERYANNRLPRHLQNEPSATASYAGMRICCMHRAIARTRMHDKNHVTLLCR